MPLLFAPVAIGICIATSATFAQSAPTNNRIIEAAKSASVLILSGEGAGRLHGIGTGTVISSDGVILTALHVVRGAAEVQVRTANGEVFDKVQLLGSDERRDVAALKISARGLSHLEAPEEAKSVSGDTIFAVTSANGLGWSATSGIISAERQADEVPGAGSGYRLIQFTAPVAPGASGGGLIASDGKLIGIITRGGNGTAFAVPVESVLGLNDLSHPTLLPSGSLLQTPKQQAESLPQSSAAISTTDPKKLIKDAKTIYLRSKTSFLTIDTLQRALLADKRWPEIGMTIVGDIRLADLVVEVDRPLFTYVHTFVLSDKRTTIVLGSGKQTAFDGTIASSGLAKDIIGILATERIPSSVKK